ncbi:hypothetical protein IP84_17150 [beta proteobacterium AAP99]|nr:hypothetical protein IP84_17150 [beta proteobacterium AAP99]
MIQGTETGCITVHYLAQERCNKLAMDSFAMVGKRHLVVDQRLSGMVRAVIRPVLLGAGMPGRRS